MSTKDNLINVGLLAAGGVAIAAASGVYGKGSRATGAATYLVVSTTERDFDTDAPLYWSNKHGWTTKRSATRFSEDEKARLRLPMGGAWEPVGKGSRAIRGMRYTLAYGGDNDSTIHVSGTFKPYSKAVDSAKKLAKRIGRTVEVREEGYDLVAFVEPSGRVDDGGYGKGSRSGSMTRDGSYEATLMFDADEDDPTVRAQRQLQANPYVPQARPLTAEPPRITSAQGSTARGSRMAGVSASVERDSLSGLWSVYLHDGRRIVNVTGDVFTTKAAAEREAKAMLAQAKAGVAIDTLGSMFWEKHHKPSSAQGSTARGSSSVLRGMTAKPGTPIPGPSLKTLDERLNLGGEEGKSLKYFMQAGQRQAALDYADELLGGSGIEYIESQQDTMRRREGLSYVNMGDTYDTTLIYDHKTGRFYVGSWGDWVERYPKRFG